MRISTPELDAVATCIGSFPHPEPEAITRLLLETLPDCPTWPQLPARAAHENMYAQYAAPLPGAVVEPQSGKTSLVASDDFTEALTGFYERVLGEDLTSFEPTAEVAAGYHALLTRLGELPPGRFLKGHVTGPISFGLTVTDAGGRAVLHDETLRDVLVQGLTAQARAQCRRLGQTGRQVILFVDEPYLSSFGSAAVPISEGDVVECLDVVTRGVLDEGALPAVHCCGNTDWSLLTRTHARIISFDAYNYLEGLTLYPAELGGFLDRGGALAWGIVPTDAATLAGAEDADLADRVRRGLDRLARTGLDGDLLRRRCLITPTCGTGTLPIPLAERAIRLTARVSARLRG